MKPSSRAEAHKIRILQIVKGLDIGGINGGAERFSIDLAFALPPEQFDVSVCAFFQHGTETEQHWVDSIQAKGIPVFFVSDWAGNNRFDRYLRGIMKLKQVLYSKPVDICHSHFQLGTLTALYLKMTGSTRCAIRTAHLAEEWEKGWYGWLRHQIISKWAYPLLLDAEVGVSQAIVDVLDRHPGVKYSRRRPIKIYNAISLDHAVQGESMTNRRPENGRLTIGVVGRLTKQKGHIYLLDAMREVVDQMPELDCWIIGDGELRETLEEKTRGLDLSNHVRFMGKRSDVSNLLKQMDLFVLPSLWEGLPTVIMESMILGVPVLATDIPGTREMITNGQNGWLVAPGDPHQLACAMLYALRSPEDRTRMALSALQTVQQYSIQQIAGQYQTVYRSLIKR